MLELAEVGEPQGTAPLHARTPVEDTALLHDSAEASELRAEEKADRSLAGKLNRDMFDSVMEEIARRHLENIKNLQSGSQDPSDLIHDPRDVIREHLVKGGSSETEAEKLLEQLYPAEYSFRPGDGVMAVWGEMGNLYPAVVDQVLEDGNFLVNWDDGSHFDREQKTHSMLPASFLGLQLHCEAKVEAWGALRGIVPALLPRWAFSVDGVSVSTRSVVGPMIPWLRVTGIVNFLTQVGILAAVTAYMAQTRQRAYPSLVWALIFPSLACKGYTEARCLRLFIVPYVLGTRKAGLAPFMGLREYKVWLPFALTCSLLLSVDMVSDSLFTGSILMSPELENLEKLWTASFNTPVLRLLHVPCPPLVAVLVAAFGWLLLQLLLPLVTLVRVQELGGRAKLNQAGSQGRGTIILPAGDVHFNDTLFFALAEPAGLATVQSLTIRAAHATVKNSKAPESLTGPAEDLQIAVALGQQMRSRILMSYVGENCVQLYIQTVLLMLRRSIAHAAEGGVSDDDKLAERQQLVSIAISILMTSMKLAEAMDFFLIARATEDLVRSRPDARRLSSEKAADARNLEGLRRSVWIVRLGCLVMASSLAVTACKLCATYRCESSMWNISEVFSESHGCLDVFELQKMIS